MTLFKYIGFAVMTLCLAHEIEANEDSSQAGNSQDEHTTRVTVDAAYGYNLGTEHYLIIFVGDKAQAVVNHQGTYIEERDEYFVPSSMKLQAAYTRPGEPFHRRYFGDKYGLNVTPNLKTQKLKYGQNRAFLRNGGPDAVGKRAGVVYFFKGCKMVKRYSWRKWGRIQDMSSAGLPCDVHAAWAEQDKMVILKGDQYWNWEPDSTVNGPHDFHSNYTLLEWTLSPA